MLLRHDLASNITEKQAQHQVAHANFSVHRANCEPGITSFIACLPFRRPISVAIEVHHIVDSLIPADHGFQVCVLDDKLRKITNTRTIL